jgi:hypothetical protein
VPLYKKALEIWEKALGPNHPYVATALNNTAFLAQAEGRPAEADRRKAAGGGRSEYRHAPRLEHVASLRKHEARV